MNCSGDDRGCRGWPCALSCDPACPPDRRTILRQWWKAAEQVYRAGRIRAKKVQERVLYQEGLAVQVSPSLKVTPLSARLHASATAG